MKLFFASGNRHKQAEVAKLFPKHEVLIPADIGIDFDPEIVDIFLSMKDTIKEIHDGVAMKLV